MSLPYQNYNDYKAQTKDLVSVLQHHISNNDSNEIDAWFEQHFAKLNQKDKSIQYDYLFRVIINSTYFFSFSSSSVNGVVASKDIIEEQQKQRHLAVLKHFPAKEQLGLVHSFLLDQTNLDSDYFIRMDVPTIQALEDKSHWHRIVSRFFYQEKFSLIDFLDTRFETSFLELSNESLQLNYKNKNSHGYFWLNHDEPVFKTYWNIIFSYSESKDAYLKEKNITKPSYEDVNFFKKILMKNKYAQGIGEEGLNNIYDNINSYQKMMYYYHLNSIIESEHGNSNDDNDNAVLHKGPKI
jgi:hypothetical protein